MTELDKKIGSIKNTIKRAAINTAITSLVKNIIGSPDGDYNAVEKTYDFVKSNIKFEEEPFGQDNYQYPTHTLQTRTGDCEDHVLLLGSLLIAQGYKVGVKLIPRGGEKYHVYLVVKTNIGWLPLDTTIPQPMGKEVGALWSKIYPV